ncbi:MAG: PIN domain-containing protein [Deltaproteobacteria bacterium]|nr:PIN domain-containing protein [Deltaproteobacteria bacterium]
MRRTAIALLFYLIFVFNAYADGLEGCEDHVKYGPPSLQPVLLCRFGYALSHYADHKYRYGIRLSRKLEHNDVALNEFLEYVTVLDWPEQAAPEYGRIRAYLEKKGTPIGANDLLIASHTLALDAVLVTDNVREFERISSLKMGNWISR